MQEGKDHVSRNHWLLTAGLVIVAFVLGGLVLGPALRPNVVRTVEQSVTLTLTEKAVSSVSLVSAVTSATSEKILSADMITLKALRNDPKQTDYYWISGPLSLQEGWKVQVNMWSDSDMFVDVTVTDIPSILLGFGGTIWFHSWRSGLFIVPQTGTYYVVIRNTDEMHDHYATIALMHV
jgi:hypothetical protein